MPSRTAPPTVSRRARATVVAALVLAGTALAGVVGHQAGAASSVTHLDPALLVALRRAEAAAAVDGVEVVVNSGWRSREHQEELFEKAVTTYGSEHEAARWVATADTSPHVSGDAVDVGTSAAARWLSEHGATYGLCQVYDNEPWHYELRPAAAAHGCPSRYADPTEDPRMRR